MFSEFKDEMLNISHCWRYFKIAELSEVMRQRGDPTFIDLLNNIRIGSISDTDIELLQSREKTRDDPAYPADAVHIWAENSFVNEHNRKRLNELQGDEFEVVAFDKLPENVTDRILDNPKLSISPQCAL